MTAKREERWSQRVTRESNALDLEKGIFSQDDPKEVARSLQPPAEKSQRRKTNAFRSAMPMLNFYINRAGSKLPKKRWKTLEAAKDELRELYGKPRQH